MWTLFFMSQRKNACLPSSTTIQQSTSAGVLPYFAEPSTSVRNRIDIFDADVFAVVRMKEDMEKADNTKGWDYLE